MCSISGVSFVPGSTINRRKIASALLKAGEARGRDAAGYGYVGPSGDGIFKNDVKGGQLYTGHIPQDATSLILHTRASTHGHPSVMENNHPVESPSGNIRMVHNGVIYNEQWVRDYLGEAGDDIPEVDSAVIPAIMELRGLDNTNLLEGYAATAWFDRDTGDTLHLARFKQAPVVFATLWDGSLAFASTPAILAEALNASGNAWYGFYPGGFDEMDEGEYFQIEGGEILSESTVGWKRVATYTGRDWSAQTEGGSTARGFSSATPATGKKYGVPAESVSKASEDKKPLTIINHGLQNSVDQAEYEADNAIGQFENSPATKATLAVVSAMFMSPDPADMSDEDYDDWVNGRLVDDDEDEVEEGEYYDDEANEWVYPSSMALDDEDEPVNSFVESSPFGDATRPAFYLSEHSGDFSSYTTASGLMSAMTWNAGLTDTENVLVGPEEGDLRWVNHFADVGTLSHDGRSTTSWIEDDTDFQMYANRLPSFVRDGVSKLRQLVGA